MEEYSRNNYCRGKAIIITYSECVSVALVMQHAKRMRNILLSHVASPTLQYFPHYLINFRKKGYLPGFVCSDFPYKFV